VSGRQRGAERVGTRVTCFLDLSICDDASSVAVSPSVVVAVGNNALSAVWVMPPCGVRARVYPDPAVLGAGLGENIVSIMLLPHKHVTDTMEQPDDSMSGTNTYI
jgi:hypothetical protein